MHDSTNLRQQSMWSDSETSSLSSCDSSGKEDWPYPTLLVSAPPSKVFSVSDSLSKMLHGPTKLQLTTTEQPTAEQSLTQPFTYLHDGKTHVTDKRDPSNNAWQ